MPLGRSAHTSIAYKNQLFIFGGINREALKELYSYSC